MHYVKRIWPVRKSYLTGVTNIENVPLVDPQNILLPPLYIKLGLMKNFVKAIGKCNLNGFTFLCVKFPSINQAKLQERIFVGPQIKEVLKNLQFEKSLSKLEQRAWQAFKWLCANFLGNAKWRSFQARVEDLLDAFREMDCCMFLKMHFRTPN